MYTWIYTDTKLVLQFKEVTLPPADVYETAGWGVNSVYPDQTLCSIVYDLGLHYLIRQASSST